MKQLRTLRKEHGWKQKDVADMLGIHVTTYTKYETGCSEPNHEMLVKLADIFDVSVDYLLDRTGKKEMPSTFVDEGQLNAWLIECLHSLTPEEQTKVVAFVQGMIAARPTEASPPA